MASVMAIGAGAAVAAFLVCLKWFQAVTTGTNISYRAGLDLSHGGDLEAALEPWARPSTRAVLSPR